MSANVSFPGVHVQEIPNGVRTIAGVATSITAFLGRTSRGPSNTAAPVSSFVDFERIFGGLWVSSSLGFAVRDFFANGGGQAIVVRLFHPDTGDPALAETQVLSVGTLKFAAASEGSWGVGLRVAVDQNDISADVAAAVGVSTTDLFNLTVRDIATGRTERHLNLTIKPGPRRADNLLLASSDLIRYVPNVGAEVAAATDPLTAKETAYTDAVKALEAKLVGDPEADVTIEQSAVTTARATRDDALIKAAAAVSNGSPLTIEDFLPTNAQADKKGLFALEQADLFNLLCIPPYRDETAILDTDPALLAAAAAFCEARRAMLIVDSPKDWTNPGMALTAFINAEDGKIGLRSHNAALFFPRLKQPNPLRDNQTEIFAACGAVAGVFARTDASRGVWKAPAGLDAMLVGVPALSVSLTDAENGNLNPLGINCLRAFPNAGHVVWGARTLRGSNQLTDDYKYVPVRRTALFIEESLIRGLKWVVFEPNDEPLWAQIRSTVGAFMHDLFREGAFQGSTAKDSFFVSCDRETISQSDIDLGIVNVVIGFSALKPAEFVVIKVQQSAGQTNV